MGFLNTAAAATAGGGSGGTLLAAAPAISAIGGVASAIGNASAQRSVLGYQQSVAQANQLLADRQAVDALTQGTYAEMNLRQQARNLKGQQRAALAANGVALNEGSPAQVLASTDAMRDADIDTIRNNAARAAFGYRTQAGNYSARANAFSGAARAVNPAMAGASSLLGSASGVASKWYDLYKNGAFGTSAPATGGESGSSLFSSSGLFGD